MPLVERGRLGGGVVLLVDAELRVVVVLVGLDLVELVQRLALMTRLDVAVVGAGVELAHGGSPQLVTLGDDIDGTACAAARNPPNVPPR